jgi:hypothetical protein
MKWLALLMLCSGCITTRAVRQAHWDHDCSRRDIEVLEQVGNTVTLDVCGQTRQYRQLRTGDLLDVTVLNAMPEKPTQPAPRVSDSPMPISQTAKCSPAQLAELRQAGVSASAIAFACDS